MAPDTASPHGLDQTAWITAKRLLAFVLMVALVAMALQQAPSAAHAQTLTECGVDDGSVYRVAGTDRVATAAAVSARHWPEATDVVLATAADFPDALAAAALTAKLNAPLLLTPGAALPAAVTDELDRLGAQRVWILGGGASVSPAVETELLAAGYTVRRLHGGNRFATAARIAAETGRTPDGEVILALGTHADPQRAWPDAVAAGALAVTPDRLPTLLSRGETLPPETVQALSDLGTRKVYVVGGTAAIAPAVTHHLEALGYEVERLAGESRYATSAAAVAEALRRQPDGRLAFVLATGRNFPDALSAAALAARMGAPVLLVPPDSMEATPAIGETLNGWSDRLCGGIVVGGAGAISEPVLAQFSAMADAESSTAEPEPEPIVDSIPGPWPAPDPVVGVAPVQVVATQGPTDPEDLYVWVTWDRSDPAAVGYEVVRDGAVVHQAKISGDAWDDLAFRDTAVQASHSYAYQVRARYLGGQMGALSSAASVYVRSDGDLGDVFQVDSYSGSDVDRAQAAVDAAVAAGGGVVQFGPGTYTFSRALEVTAADNVVLRGAGMDATYLQPGFAGESATCGNGGRLIGFTARRTALAADLAAPVAVGDRTIHVTSTSELSVGRRIVLYEPGPLSGATPLEYDAAGVVQDPGTGQDERHRWDAGEIVAVDAAAKTVTFKYPLSQSFTTAVPLVWIEKGNGNGLERLTVQGRSDQEQTHYRLVDVNHQGGFAMAGVQGRWANRNYLRASGYDNRVVDFRGPLGDPGGTSGTCKYKFSVWRSANFTFVGGEMGEPGHAHNTSFITTQRAQRTLVRHSRFWGNQTYAFNEHGLGSRHWVFENNYVAVGPTAKAGVLLGNSSWGFGGAGIIRNNSFEGNYRDVAMQENSYEVRILDNVMRNTVDRVVTGYGWASLATAVDLHGSIRWTIARNHVENAKDGIVLGEASSPWYPYTGVKDVVITGNHLQVTGTAINLAGSTTTTQRFQVSSNTGTNRYTHPEFTPGVHWAANADSITYGEPTSVPWTQPTFAWQVSDS